MGLWSVCRVEFGAHDLRVGPDGLHCAGGGWIGHTGCEGLFEWRRYAGYILTEDSGRKGEIFGSPNCFL